MNRIATMLAATVALLVAISFSTFLTTAEAQNRPDAQWQYAYVGYANYPSDISIIYVDVDGCRLEPVKVDPVRSSPGWTTIDTHATQEKAVGQAVRLLGANGWEMIGDGHPYCGGYGDKAIHFKRVMR